MRLPLEGIIVVALEQAVAIPFATRQLADLGARVIKVERPSGDFARDYDTEVKGMASHFVWLNRNKESVVLDLKSEDGKRAMDKLISKADVFLQNLAPGAAARLGLGAEELRSRNPKLIVGNLSGYGSTGPYRDKKAYDLLVQCEAGLVSITGTPAEPVKSGISVADIAGGMYAYTGVLTALYERERTGEGSFFEVSLLDALAEWMGYPYYYAEYGGAPPARTGSRHAAIAPYGPFRTANGSKIFLAVQNDREWQKLCDVVLETPAFKTDPRFATNPDRVRNVQDLNTAIEETFAKLTPEEAVERLDRAQIANAQMRTIDEFAKHPQLAARNRWHEVDSPVGLLRALQPPVTVPGQSVRMDRIPGLGEHTKTILTEIGEIPSATAVRN